MIMPLTALALSLVVTLLPLSEAVIVNTNPFANYEFYVPQQFIDNIETSMALHPSESIYYETVASYPAAIYLDSVASISNLTTEMALMSTEADGDPYVMTIILMNIPDTQCNSGINAEWGDFTCVNTACTSGINGYKTQFIDPIYNILNSYSNSDPNLQVYRFSCP